MVGVPAIERLPHLWDGRPKTLHVLLRYYDRQLEMAGHVDGRKGLAQHLFFVVNERPELFLYIDTGFVERNF